MVSRTAEPQAHPFVYPLSHVCTRCRVLGRIPEVQTSTGGTGPCPPRKCSHSHREEKPENKQRDEGRKACKGQRGVEIQPCEEAHPLTSTTMYPSLVRRTFMGGEGSLQGGKMGGQAKGETCTRSGQRGSRHHCAGPPPRPRPGVGTGHWLLL